MAEAAKYVEHSAEEWYHTTRRRYGHSRLLLEPVILRPVCDDCLARLDLPTSLDRCWDSRKERDTDVVVLPEEDEARPLRDLRPREAPSPLVESGITFRVVAGCAVL